MSRPRTRTSATRKRLSQNFLTHPGTAHRIVESSGVAPGDLIVEIGPGDGMLTRSLLQRTGRVIAYEKDVRRARQLAARYAEDSRLRVVPSDFRTVTAPPEPFAVVANIPFAASTDILRWCLAAPRLTTATLLTQEEFARKHSGDYGRWSKLTVAHWPDSVPTLGPRIRRREFFPVPGVDAAVLHIMRRPVPLLPPPAHANYLAMVDLGFSGVGGSLAASLRRAYPARAVTAACAAAGIDTDCPVGLISPEAWLTLYHRLGHTGSSTPRPKRSAARRHS